MATGPQQKRKELREKRLKAEAAAKGADRKQNMTKVIGAVIGVVILAVIVAVAAGAFSGDGDEAKPKGSAEIEKMLAGIPQKGTVLGDPDAKVTLVEFGDLQCPACQQYAQQILPDVISGPIKNGTANFDMRQWTILGDDSRKAAMGAYAAGEQNRYWNFVEQFYADQGLEGSGYVTDDFLKEIAQKAGVPDIDKWETDRKDEVRWSKNIDETFDLASDLGFSGTPSFAIQVDGGELEVLNDTTSADQINKALEKAAKGG